MSVNPLTLVANHMMLSAGVIVNITELIAPLTGTIIEVQQLTGTIRCLDE